MVHDACRHVVYVCRSDAEYQAAEARALNEIQIYAHPFVCVAIDATHRAYVTLQPRDNVITAAACYIEPLDAGKRIHVLIVARHDGKQVSERTDVDDAMATRIVRTLAQSTLDVRL
jgi:hypothetical protein